LHEALKIFIPETLKTQNLKSLRHSTTTTTICTEIASEISTVGREPFTQIYREIYRNLSHRILDLVTAQPHQQPLSDRSKKIIKNRSDLLIYV
jgi:hypothetical protein